MNLNDKPYEQLLSRIRELETQNTALRELVNDISVKIDSMGTSVTVASFGNALLNRIDAARKK